MCNLAIHIKITAIDNVELTRIHADSANIYPVIQVLV